MLGSTKQMWWQTTRGWFAAILIAVIALNAAIFWKIEDLTVTQRTKALSRGETSDLIQMAFASTHSRTRLDMYVALGHIAPGSTFTLVGMSLESRELITPFLFSLGSASAVAGADTAFDYATALESPHAYVAATGAGGTGGPPWTVYLDSTLGLAVAEIEPDKLVDALADPVWRSTFPAGPPRTFIIVQQEPALGAEQPGLLVIDATLVTGDSVETPA